MQIPAAATAFVPPSSGTTSPIDSRPLTPRVDGTLRLASPDAAGRSFVSAASGLAAAPGGSAWVVSDEYGALVRFDALDAPGTLHAGLVHGEHKPDLEAVLVIDADASSGEPAMLFAAGSGSGTHRNRGVVQDLDAAGAPLGAPREIDLKPLYARLAGTLPELNVEGMALRQTRTGAELLVFHRGQRLGNPNQIFRLDAAVAIDAMRRGGPLPASALAGVTQLDLGTIDGVPLGFADARALPDGRIAFLASAEDSQNGPHGETLGTVVGLLDSQLNVTTLRPLTGPARKAEGIELAAAFDASAGANELVLVTDPDDAAKPTERLRVDLDAS